MLLFTFNFKDWKIVIKLLVLFIISYFIALSVSFLFSFNLKQTFIKYTIPVILLIIAITIVLNYRLEKKNKTGYILALLFGFFNGLGFYFTLKNQMIWLESAIFPVLESLVGIFIAVLLIALLILAILFLLQKILYRFKFNWILVIPIIVAILALKETAAFLKI